jgi:uncharacterized membrane protein YkvA (DUF1232 family)
MAVKHVKLPHWGWIFLIIGIVYWINPFDFIPDFFVGIGWLDELILFVVLYYTYRWIYRKKRTKK